MEAVHPLAPIAAVRSAATEADDQNLNAGSRLLSQLTPGQRVRVTVREILSNSDFVVALEPEGGKALRDQLMHMSLPPGARPGDLLSLVFVSREPRLKFALLADLQSEGDVFRPSETGGFIDRLLRSPSLADRFINSSVAPLLGAPPDDPAELSLRLAKTLERSGLFYESHLAQWIVGKRGLVELLLEPQARLGGSRLITSTGSGDNQYSEAADVTAQTENSMHETVQRAALYHEQAHNEALSLMRQQLEALETRHIAWQGEAWPGQSITVEFFDEDSCTSTDTDQADHASGNVWKTRLCLTLPNLGKVTGNVQLHTHGLEIDLAMANPATVATLRAGAAMLSQGLESEGITLLRVAVDVNEKTESP